MAKIVFVEPPAPRRAASKYPWEEIAAQLKERPGEWALCLKGITATPASAIKAGKYVPFAPAGSFDARSVGVSDKEGKTVYDIYIKYVGDPTDAATDQENTGQ